MRNLVILVGILLLAGCSLNTNFVYKPSAPATRVSKLPVKIAVLPFADGSENFTQRGNVLFSPEYNLAKGGIPAQMTALTPELWAKAFAAEMASSGEFHAVRFIYDRAEIADEDYIINGTLEKAYAAFKASEFTYQFALVLSAQRKTDGLPVWKKNVTRDWCNEAGGLYKGCGPLSAQCMVDSHHTYVNRAMQEILAEARADLVQTLAPLSGGRAGQDDLLPAVSPRKMPAPESADELIEDILKTK